MSLLKSLLTKCRILPSSRSLGISPVAFAFLATSAAAQQPSPPPNLEANPSGAATAQGGLIEFGTAAPYIFWLTVLTVVFGTTVIGLLLWYYRGASQRQSDNVSRLVVVLAVITGTLVLVTAGYSNQQIAPAFGLFGTIVGYLLGRLERDPRSSEVARSADNDSKVAPKTEGRQ